MIIAYVDDSENERNQALPIFLKGFHHYKIPIHRFDFFENGESFFSKWETGAYDLIILDIFIGNDFGFDLAKRIREKDKDVRIVFCSCSNEFANESYDVNACYYLQKPVNEKNVQRMISRLNMEDFELRRFIVLPDGQKVVLRNIIYAEYRNHLIEIHMKKGEPIKTWLSHSAFIDLMQPYDFLISCNRGSVINLYEVNELTNKDFIMSDSTCIPVSRRKIPEIKELYQNFLIHSIRKEM